MLQLSLLRACFSVLHHFLLWCWWHLWRWKQKWVEHLPWIVTSVYQDIFMDYIWTRGNPVLVQLLFVMPLSRFFARMIKRCWVVQSMCACEKKVHTQTWLVVSNSFYFHTYLGKISNLTIIFFRWVGSTTNQKHTQTKGAFNQRKHGTCQRRLLTWFAFQPFRLAHWDAHQFQRFGHGYKTCFNKTKFCVLPVYPYFHIFPGSFIKCPITWM